MTPQAPVAVDAVLGVLGLTMAVGLWLAAPTSSRYWLHSYLVVIPPSTVRRGNLTLNKPVVGMLTSPDGVATG